MQNRNYLTQGSLGVVFTLLDTEGKPIESYPYITCKDYFNEIFDTIFGENTYKNEVVYGLECSKKHFPELKSTATIRLSADTKNDYSGDLKLSKEQFEKNLEQFIENFTKLGFDFNTKVIGDFTFDLTISESTALTTWDLSHILQEARFVLNSELGQPKDRSNYYGMYELCDQMSDELNKRTYENVYSFHDESGLQSSFNYLCNELNLTQVLVYGTLKKGYGNYKYLLENQSVYLGEFKLSPLAIPGKIMKMYHLGGFPGVKVTTAEFNQDRKDIVDLTVQKFAVTPEVLKRLDGLEGYRPDNPTGGLYNKMFVPGQNSWIYTYNGSPREESLITSGNYE